MYLNCFNSYRPTALSLSLSGLTNLKGSKVTLTCQIIQHGDPSGVGHECDGKKSLVSDVNDIDSSAFGPWNVRRGGAPVVCGEFVIRFRQ